MDNHECGACKARFSQIEEFVAHKKSGCQVSGYSRQKVDALISQRDAMEGTVGTVYKSRYPDRGNKPRDRVAGLFKEFLLTQSDLDLDRMVEKAKNGEKADLENSLQNFVEHHKVNVRRKYSDHQQWKPNTQIVYLNLLKSWIYEYSGGLVDLRGNSSIVRKLNSLQAKAAADDCVEKDQESCSSTGVDMDEQDFPKRCPYCPPLEAWWSNGAG